MTTGPCTRRQTHGKHEAQPWSTRSICHQIFQIGQAMRASGLQKNHESNDFFSLRVPTTILMEFSAKLSLSLTNEPVPHSGQLTSESTKTLSDRWVISASHPYLNQKQQPDAICICVWKMQGGCESGSLSIIKKYELIVSHYHPFFSIPVHDWPFIANQYSPSLSITSINYQPFIMMFLGFSFRLVDRYEGHKSLPLITNRYDSHAGSSMMTKQFHH